jgi:hypothetical protein
MVKTRTRIKQRSKRVTLKVDDRCNQVKRITDPQCLHEETTLNPPYDSDEVKRITDFRFWVRLLFQTRRTIFCSLRGLGP